MNNLEKFFMEINKDIRNLLKEKGFDFKPIGTLKTSTGMKKEEFRVEKEDLSIIISIQEVEKLPLR